MFQSLKSYCGQKLRIWKFNMVQPRQLKRRLKSQLSKAIALAALCTNVREKIPDLAKGCVQLVQNMAFRLQIVPFRRNRMTARVEMLPWPALMLHYMTVLALVFSALHKATAAVSHFMAHQLELESVICGVVSLTYFSGLGGLALNGQRVVDWLNLMESPLRIIGHMKGKRVTVYDHLPTSIRLVMNVVMAAVFAGAASFLPFFFPHLPIFIAPALMNAGIISDGPVIGQAWRLILYPVEFLSFVIPLSLILFYVVLVEVAIAGGNVASTELGLIPVRNVSTRREMERLYVQFEIINILVNSALRQCLPCVFFALGTDAVIGLFLFLKHSQYSMEVINVVIAVCGVVCLGILLNVIWASCNTMKAFDRSAGLLKLLRSTNHGYFRRLPERERLELLKRARPMKVFHIYLGHFGKFDLDFVVAMWDEILSQLLFLLSF